MIRWFLLLALGLTLAGCESDPCEGLHDLTATPGGLELTEQEHLAGWGQTECFQCHQAFAIHTQACTSDVLVEVGDIEEQIDAEHTETCVPCHGDNGVEAWQDTGGTR